MMENISGRIVGYDPGGEEDHGFAELRVENGEAQSLKSRTLDNAEAVIKATLDTEKHQDLIGVGIDTMTCWSTGKSGWRPADNWLRNQYDEVEKSVVSPNSMQGSMGINGMAVLIAVRNAHNGLFVTETHPKVLYYALFEEKYDYGEGASMDDKLEKRLNLEVETGNDHEWDAAVSTLVALRGLEGKWEKDLHENNDHEEGRIIEPCGKTHYYWPSEEAE